MKSHEIVLSCAVATRTPLLLWGMPGIGKTATIRALAKAYGYALEVVIASIHEPADFSGLPYPDNDRVRYLPPEWAVRLAKAAENGQGAILFLDEISTAPPAVQAALLRVAQERVVGQLALPPNVVVLAAANPPEVAAGGWELSPPLANRFAHVEFPPSSASEWSQGLLQGFRPPELPLAENWEDKLPIAAGLVSAFVESRPDVLNRLPEDPAQRGKAWPSARSWEMATRMLAACLSVTQDEGAIAAVVGACVGQGLGIELAALASGDVLLDPLDALERWDKVELPQRADKVLVLLNAVTALLAQTPPKDRQLLEHRWIRVWKLVARVANERGPDVAAMAVRGVQAIWADLMTEGIVIPLPHNEVRAVKPLIDAVTKHANRREQP